MKEEDIFDSIFVAILSGDQTAEIFLRQGTEEQKIAAQRYLEAKEKMMNFYKTSPTEETKK